MELINEKNSLSSTFNHFCLWQNNAYKTDWNGEIFLSFQQRRSFFPACNQKKKKKNNDFFTFRLTKLPQILIAVDPTLWLKWQFSQSPLTFQAEHSSAVPWRGWCSGSLWPAVLGTAVSHPPPQQPPPENSGQPASACYYRKPLPNPSFLARLLTPPYLSVISHQEPVQDPLERQRSPGSAVSVHPDQCCPGIQRASPCVCGYLSVLSIAEDETLRVINSTEITGFGLTACCWLPLTLIFPVPFWSHALFSDVEQSYTGL